MANKAACCPTETTNRPCPACGTFGHPVSSLTLENHLRRKRLAEFGLQGSFCANPACVVVYFNPSGKTVSRGQTVRPITVKDQGDEIPICYCFEFMRGDLRRDLTEKGATAIPNEIKKGIIDGRCDCELKNPQGTCCLGNVASAIKKIQTEMSRE